MAKVKRSGTTPPATKASLASADHTREPDNPTPPSPAADPRDTTIRALQVGLTVVSIIAIGLAIAVVLLALRSTPAPTASGTPSTSASAKPLYLTKYVAVNPESVKSDAIVVELHTDYQCPWCGRAELIYGNALAQLSQSGDVELRIHLRTLVGDQIIHNDSSQRSAMAATCADTVGAFWAYHSAIFAHQPEEGVGFTDAQLREDFASEAGITGTDLTKFQQCYDDKQTSGFVQEMEQEGSAAGINGTPTFYVNGVKVSFNLQSEAQNGAVSTISADSLLASLKSLSTGQ
ncbi:MAG: DsbA family protein [Propionibacteriaceae bacterium]|jgi:protein-disulfide isomerase|nr:DsbA family protein [Propionibacteriaceae bacterium]